MGNMKTRTEIVNLCIRELFESKYLLLNYNLKSLETVCKLEEQNQATFFEIINLGWQLLNVIPIFSFLFD